LYDLAENQDSFVHAVASDEWVIRFKVRSHGVIRDQWFELASKLNNVNLSDEKEYTCMEIDKIKKILC
jgi:hypothetical protein